MIFGKKKNNLKRTSLSIWILSLLLLLTVSLLLGGCQTQGDTGGESISEETLETKAITSKSLPDGENSPSQATDQDAVEGIVVYLTVNSVNAVRAGVAGADKYAPDGYILKNESLTISEGSSVLDLLKASSLIINASNHVLGPYIKSIEGITEDKGGWIFSINGEFPHTSISNISVENGDEVVFHYSVTPGDVPGSPY